MFLCQEIKYSKGIEITKSNSAKVIGSRNLAKEKQQPQLMESQNQISSKNLEEVPGSPKRKRLIWNRGHET